MHALDANTPVCHRNCLAFIRVVARMIPPRSLARSRRITNPSFTKPSVFFTDTLRNNMAERPIYQLLLLFKLCPVRKRGCLLLSEFSLARITCPYQRRRSVQTRIDLGCRHCGCDHGMFRHWFNAASSSPLLRGAVYYLLKSVNMQNHRRRQARRRCVNFGLKMFVDA